MPKRINHGVTSIKKRKSPRKTAKRKAAKKIMLANKPGRKNK